MKKDSTPEGRERRKLIQDLFIRCCRDSGFRLDTFQAARLAAAAGGFHPLDVWMALPSLAVMHEIAAGTHPASQKEPRP